MDALLHYSFLYNYIILKYSSKHQVGLKGFAGSIKGLTKEWIALGRDLISLSGLRSWIHKKKHVQKYNDIKHAIS